MVDTGGKMTQNTKWGEHDDSIASNLNRLPPEVQVRYRENRRKYREDCASLDEWYAQGFSSGWERDLDDLSR
jgi:ABC-type Zn uptake system ZnuABC Zn-binding protein ZnuA